MKIGLIADLHGDFEGFQSALRLLDAAGAERILCAGDVVDRGPKADAIIQVLKERNISCIRGNHDVTVVAHQTRWRAMNKPDRLRTLGRIISDESLAYLSALPETLSLTIGGLRALLAHGTPWSDVMAIFPDTRQAILDRVAERYGQATDLIILGHTHQPMLLRVGGVWIANPGSVYGVTARDSHTCALITLPEMAYTVFDLTSGNRVGLPVVCREVETLA